MDSDPLRSDYSPAPIQPSLWLGNISDSVVRGRPSESEDTGESRATSGGGGGGSETFHALQWDYSPVSRPSLDSRPGKVAKDWK